MKKNKMMRLASALLVLTLLTTGIIGGTLAKYVSSESSTDMARVAKFGVVATASGDLFGSTYKAAEKNNGGNTIISYDKNGGTVSADNKDKVVAPGTKDDKGLTLSVKGTPEVSTKVTFDDAPDSVNSDIYLKSGEYGVMVEYTGDKTEENVIGYYTLSGDTYTIVTEANATTAATDTVYELRDVASVTEPDGYYPLKWTVTSTAPTPTPTPAAPVSKVTDVKTELEKIFGTSSSSKTFKPNEENKLNAKVTWEWPIQNGDTDDEKTANDKKDTILGDMIAIHLDTSDPEPYAVVKKDNAADTYSAVNYASISDITVAYTGNSAPAALNDATICACLTVAFGASLTVEQVD